MSLNRFQKFLLQPEASLVIADVIKHFHPGYTPTTALNKVKKLVVYPKYDWIIIEQGDVNIGISYRVAVNGQLLMGPKQTINEFIKAYDTSYFQAWRFINDRSYEPGGDNNHNMSALFIQHGVPKPTAQEMYDYYYKE